MNQRLLTLARVVPLVAALLLPASITAQKADPALVQSIRQCLQKALAGTNFDLGELATSTSGGALRVSGPGTLLNHAVTVSGEFTSDPSLQAVEITLAGVKLSLADFNRIAGNPGTILPSGLALNAGVLLKRLRVDRDTTAKKIASMTVGFAPTTKSWQPLGAGLVNVSDVAVELEVLRPKDSDRDFRGVVRGVVALGANVKFDLSGTLAKKPEDLELTASVQNGLDFAALAKGIGGTAAQQAIAPLPTKLKAAQVSNLEMSVQPGAKSLALRGGSNFGRMQFVAQPKGLMVGIAPPANFKLGQLDPALRSLDAGNIDFSGLALVVSSMPGTLHKSLAVGNTGAAVAKGLNLYANLDLRPLKMDRMLKVNALNLRAQIPYPNPMNLVLAAGIQTDIDLGGGAKFKEVVFELRPSPKRFKLALQGKMDLRVQRETLGLMGEMAVEPLTQTVSGTFALDPRSGEWKDPFGVKGVGVPKLAVSLGATFGTGIPLPTMGLQAGLRLGAGRNPIRGNGVVVLNPRDPMNSMIAFDVQSVSLMRLVAMASPPTSAKVQRTPLAQAMKALLVRNVAVRIVPNDIDFAGSTFERGFKVAGDIKLLGVNAKALFDVDFSKGITALATMDAINLANGAVKITGARGRRNPIAKLDLRMDQQGLLVNGKLAVLKDMFVSETDLRVSPQGMNLYSRGKIFGKAQATIEMRASGSFGDRRADFLFRARMEQSLLQDIRKKALAHIDNATRKHVKKILQAKRNVAKEQKKVNDFSIQIAATRKRVKARQDRDIANMRKAANASKAKADKEYKRLGRLISSKKKARKKANIFKKGTLTAEIGVLETRRRAQRLVLDKIGSNLIKGLANVGKKFPKELSSEIGPMLAGQKVAQGALAAAQGVLTGYKGVVTGTMSAAKWIADNGLGGAFDVNVMQFETKLSTARGSSFAVLMKGKFLKKDFQTQARLNLRSPDQMAKDIANMFLNKRNKKRTFRTTSIRRVATKPLAPPRALPALTAAQLLTKARTKGATTKPKGSTRRGIRVR